MAQCNDFPQIPCYNTPNSADPPAPLRIKYILILLSALSFAVTEFCSSRINRKYAALDGSSRLRLKASGGETKATSARYGSRLNRTLFLNDALSDEFDALFGRARLFM